jgi:hypothetical protein
VTDNTIRHPVVLCWHCDHMLDAATPMAEPATPHHGDISLCLYCGVICVFDFLDETEELTLRCPTTKELDDATKESEFRKNFLNFQWARQQILAEQKGELSLMRDYEEPDR